MQHKLLWKGEYEQASLAKVFDDPAMRPKPMGREPVNKPHTSLMTTDIWGAMVRGGAEMWMCRAATFAIIYIYRQP